MTMGCMPSQQSTDTGVFDKAQTIITPVSTKKLECGHTNTPIDVNVHVFVHYENEPTEDLPTKLPLRPKADNTKKKLPLKPDTQKIQDDVICVGCDDDEDENQQQDKPVDVDIEFDPVTGDYNVIIKDFQLDLGE